MVSRLCANYPALQESGISHLRHIPWAPKSVAEVTLVVCTNLAPWHSWPGLFPPTLTLGLAMQLALANETLAKRERAKA